MKTLAENDAIILLYHGVTSRHHSGVRNYAGKHIHRDVFEEHMSILANTCNPVSCRALVRMLAERGPLPERAVAVTFDDSFENVFKNACPILRKYKVPATMFLTTGFVGTDRIIWADILEIVFSNHRENEFHVDCGEFAVKYSTRTDAEKTSALFEIKALLKSVDEKRKDAVMDYIVNTFDVDPFECEGELYSNLTWNQVRQMDQDPLFEIGSHTVNHRVLTFIDLREAEYEIAFSKAKLEEELGHSVELFSYPEGQKAHFNNDIIDLLKANGFISSPSAIYGTNKPGDDPFRLKRIMVGFDGTRFPFDEES